MNMWYINILPPMQFLIYSPNSPAGLPPTEGYKAPPWPRLLMERVRGMCLISFFLPDIASKVLVSQVWNTQRQIQIQGHRPGTHIQLRYTYSNTYRLTCTHKTNIHANIHTQRHTHGETQHKHRHISKSAHIQRHTYIQKQTQKHTKDMHTNAYTWTEKHINTYRDTSTDAQTYICTQR